jgi:hypothetical protein
MRMQVLTVRQATEWTAHVAETAAETGLSGTNGLFEVRLHERTLGFCLACQSTC